MARSGQLSMLSGQLEDSVTSRRTSPSTGRDDRMHNRNLRQSRTGIRGRSATTRPSGGRGRRVGGAARPCSARRAAQGGRDHARHRRPGARRAGLVHDRRRGTDGAGRPVRHRGPGCRAGVPALQLDDLDARDVIVVTRRGWQPAVRGQWPWRMRPVTSRSSHGRDRLRCGRRAPGRAGGGRACARRWTPVCWPRISRTGRG